MNFGEPMLFDEALQLARRKGELPTTLNSREIAALPQELLQRATFSAKVDQGGLLSRLGTLTRQIAAGEEDANGRLISYAEAKAQLKEYLDSISYQPRPGTEGTLQDLTSDARRQLQVETTVLDTMNHGRWTALQNTDELAVNPGLELVRVRASRVPRDWQERWSEALDACGDASGVTDPAYDGGRMVALVNHPIWQALGDGAGGYDDTLGNPWAPFAFNSGMGTISVGRRACVALGIIHPTQQVAPQQRGLNESLQASVTNFDRAVQAALNLDPALSVVDGVLKLVGLRS